LPEQGRRSRSATTTYLQLVDEGRRPSGMLAPTLRETMWAMRQLLEFVRTISKFGLSGGLPRDDGRREARPRTCASFADSVVVHEGNLSTLKRFKDEAPRCKAGQECGLEFRRELHDMRVGGLIACTRRGDPAATLYRRGRNERKIARPMLPEQRRASTAGRSTVAESAHCKAAGIVAEDENFG